MDKFANKLLKVISAHYFIQVNFDILKMKII